MKFRRTVPPEDEGLPITNLIDLLFLLIVFFMVGTVLAIQRGLEVKLPETRQPGRISTKGVNVLIDRDGKIFVDATPVPLEQVGPAVAERQRTQGANVILKCDRDTRYQAIAEVVDRLLAAGISDLSLPVVETRGG